MNQHKREGWLIWELPVYQGNNQLAKTIYNCGTYAKSYGKKDCIYSVMQSVFGTSFEEVLCYIEVLKENGFYEESSTIIESNYFYRLLRENQRVCVNFYENSKKVIIVFEYEKGLTPKEISYTYCPKAGEQSEVYLFGLKMDPKGMNRKVPENTSGFVNNGQSMIIKCADNSVIIVDGGDVRQMEDDDVKRFSELLHKITGKKEEEPIVISAWYISHIHNDHVSGICKAIGEEYDKYRVERVICNAPHTTAVQCAQEHMYEMTAEFLRRCYPTCQEVKVHTGDVIRIADVTLTIVYTHEDLADENGEFSCSDFNATSTVAMAETASGMRILITGDINEMAEDMLCTHFTGETLKCDILQQPHHNFNDNRLVYEYGNADVMLFTQTSGGLVKNEMMTTHSDRAKSWCKEWYCGGDETVGFAYEEDSVKCIYHKKDIY